MILKILFMNVRKFLHESIYNNNITATKEVLLWK